MSPLQCLFVCCTQSFVKGEVFCFTYPYFFLQNGESTSTASQQTSTASQLSKDINKVPLLSQNLGSTILFPKIQFPSLPGRMTVFLCIPSMPRILFFCNFFYLFTISEVVSAIYPSVFFLFTSGSHN